MDISLHVKKRRKCIFLKSLIFLAFYNYKMNFFRNLRIRLILRNAIYATDIKNKKFFRLKRCRFFLRNTYVNFVFYNYKFFCIYIVDTCFVKKFRSPIHNYYYSTIIKMESGYFFYSNTNKFSKLIFILF